MLQRRCSVGNGREVESTWCVVRCREMGRHVQLFASRSLEYPASLPPVPTRVVLQEGPAKTSGPFCDVDCRLERIDVPPPSQHERLGTENPRTCHLAGIDQLRIGEVLVTT